jgi:hypothetical protein
MTPTKMFMMAVLSTMMVTPAVVPFNRCEGGQRDAGGRKRETRADGS